MLTLSVFALLACTSEPAPDSAECSVEDLRWANYGDIFFRDWCRSCHSANSPNRFGAPEEVNFDTLQEVRDDAAAIDASVMDSRSMPWGGGITDAEREKLSAYLACGAPA